MAQETIIIHGLRELNQAFRAIDAGLVTGMRRGLQEAAKPVAESAHIYSLGRIRNMTEPWSEYRIGATQRMVYVAPRQRGRKRGSRRRPNFAGLLAERAMEPALADNQQQVETRVWSVIERTARKAGF